MSDYRQTHLSRCTRRFPVARHYDMGKMEELTLTFTHLKKGRPSSKVISVNGEAVIIGRDKKSSFVVDSLQVDLMQVSITALEDELLFLDRGRQSIATFNGRPGRQYMSSLDDCTVIKVDDDVIIYHGLRLQATERPEAETYIELLSSAQRVSFFSEGRPLIIGQSLNCEVPLQAEGAPQYAAAVYWSEYGIIIDPLCAKSGLKVNDYPIEEAVVLQTGDQLAFGEEVFSLNFRGDVNEASQTYFPPLLEDGDIGMSVIHGPCKPQRVWMGEDAFSVGNSPDDEFCLEDENLAPSVFQVVPRGFCFSLRRDPSGPEVFINGVSVKSGLVYPGDVLAVGENVLVPYFR